MKIGIIGAGPAGLTCAYVLSREGHTVEVFEADGAAGGMCRTITLWGQKVDLGPHRFFSSDPRINKLWLEVAGADYAMVDRLTRIYYNSRFFYYPLKPWNALGNLGLPQATVCIASYLRELIFKTPQDGSFETWGISRFGRKLYEIFFKTYTEKLWGMSCKELDADFAAQRIRKLSLLEVAKDALCLGGKNTHKTLVDQFAYPLEGTGMIYARMAAAVEANGGTVRLGLPVARVRVESGRVTGIVDAQGGEHEFEAVVSTMPITQLLAGLPEAPAPVRQAGDRLRYRNTTLVYLLVDHPELFRDNWLYIHAANLRMGRVTNFRNWVPQLYGESRQTILALEYWCYDEDEFWRTADDELVRMATEEMRQTGLLKGRPVLAGSVVRVPKSYPVYYRGYKTDISLIEAHLDTIRGLTVIGRGGAYKYNNQDHSILMGLLAAEKVGAGAGHNLWQVNSDDEYHESAEISKTGLVIHESKG
mgnify:CR=1 FL=1